MSYKIYATRIENGTECHANNAETLGDAYEQDFDTRDAAQTALNGLESDKADYGMEDVTYRIECE